MKAVRQIIPALLLSKLTLASLLTNGGQVAQVINHNASHNDENLDELDDCMMPGVSAELRTWMLSELFVPIMDYFNIPYPREYVDIKTVIERAVRSCSHSAATSLDKVLADDHRAKNMTIIAHLEYLLELTKSNVTNGRGLASYFRYISGLAAERVSAFDFHTAHWLLDKLIARALSMPCLELLHEVKDSTRWRRDNLYQIFKLVLVATVCKNDALHWYEYSSDLVEMAWCENRNNLKRWINDLPITPAKKDHMIALANWTPIRTAILDPEHRPSSDVLRSLNCDWNDSPMSLMALDYILKCSSNFCTGSTPNYKIVSRKIFDIVTDAPNLEVFLTTLVKYELWNLMELLLHNGLLNQSTFSACSYLETIMNERDILPWNVCVLVTFLIAYGGFDAGLLDTLASCPATENIRLIFYAVQNVPIRKTITDPVLDSWLPSSNYLAVENRYKTSSQKIEVLQLPLQVYLYRQFRIPMTVTLMEKVTFINNWDEMYHAGANRQYCWDLIIRIKDDKDSHFGGEVCNLNSYIVPGKDCFGLAFSSCGLLMMLLCMIFPVLVLLNPGFVSASMPEHTLGRTVSEYSESTESNYDYLVDGTWSQNYESRSVVPSSTGRSRWPSLGNFSLLSGGIILWRAVTPLIGLVNPRSYYPAPSDVKDAIRAAVMENDVKNASFLYSLRRNPKAEKMSAFEHLQLLQELIEGGLAENQCLKDYFQYIETRFNELSREPVEKLMPFLNLLINAGMMADCAKLLSLIKVRVVWDDTNLSYILNITANAASFLQLQGSLDGFFMWYKEAADLIVATQACSGQLINWSEVPASTQKFIGTLTNLAPLMVTVSDPSPDLEWDISPAVNVDWREDSSLVMLNCILKSALESLVLNQQKYTSVTHQIFWILTQSAKSNFSVVLSSLLINAQWYVVEMLLENDLSQLSNIVAHQVLSLICRATPDRPLSLAGSSNLLTAISFFIAYGLFDFKAMSLLKFCPRNIHTCLLAILLAVNDIPIRKLDTDPIMTVWEPPTAYTQCVERTNIFANGADILHFALYIFLHRQRGIRLTAVMMGPMSIGSDWTQMLIFANHIIQTTPNHGNSMPLMEFVI